MTFPLDSLTRSDVATRKGLDNTPDTTQTENLRALWLNVLEPLAACVGKPLRINSGFRSPEVNKEIGGAKNSQHMRGYAADIEVDGFDNKQLAALVLELKLPFDQLILEHHTPGIANSGWVHVSHVRDGVQRGSVLHSTFVKGKAAFGQGLV
jgi:zinc D-Ala-D-Ala carboxypeptidase